jgi:uncharacterized membrane protein SpoIIM required for sporulation
LAFFSGVAAGFFQVQADETSFYSIVDDSIAQNRGPKSSVESLRNSVYSPWSGFEKSFIVFAGYLFRHNSFIAFLCFGLGFALGVPTVILLFQNGQMVGAFFAIHYAKGLGLDFFAWLAIHGVTEISAILIAGAAGIGVAERIFLPGERTRRENLAKEGPTVAAAMVGAVFMLMIAGILEGGFRQYFGSIFPRLLVAALTLYGWLYYFLSFGHEDEG